MAKQPSQLAKIHLVAVAPRLAKGFSSSFLPLSVIILAKDIVWSRTTVRRRPHAQTFAPGERQPPGNDAFHAVCTIPVLT